MGISLLPSVMQMEILSFIPGVGGQEYLLIFLVLLLLFGAKKLPELARGIGKSMGEFRRAKDEFEHEIMTNENQKANKPTEGDNKA